MATVVRLENGNGRQKKVKELKVENYLRKS